MTTSLDNLLNNIGAILIAKEKSSDFMYTSAIQRTQTILGLTEYRDQRELFTLLVDSLQDARFKHQYDDLQKAAIAVAKTYY